MINLSSRKDKYAQVKSFEARPSFEKKYDNSLFMINLNFEFKVTKMVKLYKVFHISFACSYFDWFHSSIKS